MESSLPEPLMRKIDCERLSVSDLDAGLVFCRDRIDRDCSQSAV